MGVSSEAFRVGDVYIDFPYEQVMFRYERGTEKVFRRFYGEEEKEVHRNSELYAEARISGHQVSPEEYALGRPDGSRT